MYGKVFDSMYEGTLYGQWQAIVTLQQMLVLCNSEGVVDMTPQALAARTSIPLDIIQKGIEVLAAPDPHSRTPGEEGRRIILLDDHRPWGWYLVNYAKYQKLKSHEEKLEADRVRIANKRKTNKINDVADSSKESHPVVNVAHLAVPVPVVNIKPPTPLNPKVENQSKKQKREKTKRSALPENAEIWEEDAEWAYAKGLSAKQVESEEEKFIAHHQAKGSEFSDWSAAWRTWVLNAIKFGLEVKPQSNALIQPLIQQDAPKHNGNGAHWSEDERTIDLEGQKIGLPREPGELSRAYCRRIADEIKRRKLIEQREVVR